LECPQRRVFKPEGESNIQDDKIEAIPPVDMEWWSDPPRKVPYMKEAVPSDQVSISSRFEQQINRTRDMRLVL
jgi:hypothetical protein